MADPDSDLPTDSGADPDRDADPPSRGGPGDWRHTSLLPFRPTLRIRLTMFYGGMFLLAGLVLVLVMYVWVDQAFSMATQFPKINVGPDVRIQLGDRQLTGDELAQYISYYQHQHTSAALHTLVLKSTSALIALLILAVAFGYAMAGRVLSPLGRITRTARQVVSSDMHRRIKLDGPDDELKELADTFDEMLERLDRSFESQRTFVSNASHELRTPLAINRTVLEVQLADPDASEELQQLGKTLLATNKRSEQLVEGLLLLARSENELTDRRPVDLAEIAGQAVEQTRAEATGCGVRLTAALESAVVSGNGVLLERIALNLVQNAVRYNLARGGSVEVSVRPVDGAGELVVTNTGPVVPGYELEHIFEPFRRGKGKERTRSDKGVGLGLSIVRSVTRAHGGAIEASARPDGGLVMRVRIPAG
ncbi:sensor histidine kinase [Streptacidiphilus cavernicola]|uniref:histidine kinase n=1 Tax=Streptacidiphilus cavernicola TaxID=3342716 RepID=A0ABV6W1F7_9ACTN